MGMISCFAGATGYWCNEDSSSLQGDEICGNLSNNCLDISLKTTNVNMMVLLGKFWKQSIHLIFLSHASQICFIKPLGQHWHLYRRSRLKMRCLWLKYHHLHHYLPDNIIISKGRETTNITWHPSSHCWTIRLATSPWRKIIKTQATIDKYHIVKSGQADRTVRPCS